MIISNKEHCLDYLGIHENLDKALRYINNTDFSKMTDDTYLIDGQDVRVKLQHMTTKQPADAKLEAHDAFADIQMVFEGEETILVCFRDGKLTLTESAPERDVSFFEGPAHPVKLTAGQFIVVFPDDVHAPGVCCGESAQIRKGVFKVRIH